MYNVIVKFTNCNLTVKGVFLKGFWIVFTGGGLGAVLRFIFSTAAADLGLSYQSTFLINLLGCVFIGFVSSVALQNEKFPKELKLFLTTGIAGGFTTFSTFCNEIFSLLNGHEGLTCSLYAGFSLVLGLFFAFFGVWLAEKTKFASFVYGKFDMDEYSSVTYEKDVNIESAELVSAVNAGNE